MNQWVRVSFYNLRQTTYKKLMRYVKGLTDELGYRFFFLFEQDPEFMLQLDTTQLKKIQTYVKDHPLKGVQLYAKYIDEPKEDNPFAIEYYCLGAKFTLYKTLDWSYRNEYLHPNEVKLFHCLCNQMFVTWEEERQFYIKCLLHRGVTMLDAIDLLEITTNQARKLRRERRSWKR